MPRNPETGLGADIHLRVPADFPSMVHMVARARGMTAASFMRSAIVDAMQRSGVQYATPDRDAA
jgi:uncharacterized protein (DUF1778 family)